MILSVVLYQKTHCVTYSELNYIASCLLKLKTEDRAFLLYHVMTRNQRDWRNRGREKWRKEGGQMRRRNEKCGEKRERRMEVGETKKQM